MTRTTFWRRHLTVWLFVVVVVNTVIDTPLAQATAVTTSTTPLTAVTTAKSYVAWRIRTFVTGSITVMVRGGSTGDGAAEFILPAGVPASACVGGGLGSVDLGIGTRSLHAHYATGEVDGGSGYGGAPPGDYFVGAIIGGGSTVAGSVGVAFVHVQAAPGTVALAMTSGPAVDLQTVDFADGNDVAINSPVGQRVVVHGYVPMTVHHELFGIFLGPPPTRIAYSDPSGAYHTNDGELNGGSFSWCRGAPGPYVLHADANVSSFPGLLPPPPVLYALLADVTLP